MDWKKQVKGKSGKTETSEMMEVTFPQVFNVFVWF